MAAVFGRYGTTPRSFGATFWNPGFKTEKTAKKREKTVQKWARYGLRKRVRVADLFVMDRYVSSWMLQPLLRRPHIDMVVAAFKSEVRGDTPTAVTALPG